VEPINLEIRVIIVHVPVLLQEMLEGLAPVSGGIYLDGTLGDGGYAEAILKASEPDGRVVGLDLDPAAVEGARVRLASFGERFVAIHGGFQDARTIMQSLQIGGLDGAVLDLGLRSEQVDDPSRGFSFRFKGPLDMRFDTSGGERVIDYLQRISAKELEEILATYGEERYCKMLARGILTARDRGKLETTLDLGELVGKLLGRRRGKIHPATRTFQALRIAVNRELENLDKALEHIPEVLIPGAALCVVSYHSLEDRAVKLAFREKKKEPGRWLIVTPRPIRPSLNEIKANPRARSARLRVLKALGNDPSPEIGRRQGRRT
jgi:16S rRNA (cytosine1402-N4)-methyltransferase